MDYNRVLILKEAEAMQNFGVQNSLPKNLFWYGDG